MLLAGGFAALVLLSGCGRPGAGDAHASNGPPPAPEVQVAEVALQAIRPWDEFNGRIEAVESVQLRSRVSGYIERIAFAEGQEVKKGQLLFVIDQRPYRAALASAQAQLERARAAAGLAQTQDQRARQLVAENAVSREEADTRAATLAQATAQVRAAEADLATARLQLDFTEVRAPITGRASRAMLTVGNMAQADQSVLTTLVSQDPVYAYFDADEHSFLRYQKAGLSGQGRAVRVALVGDSGFAHAGTLDFSDNQLQPGTGTMRLRARLANPDRVLTPGLFARVQMQSGPDPQGGESQALLIDDKAVLTDQDRKYVYVVGEGNVAERRDLTLGRMVDGRRLVEKGLAAGDRLVVGGVQRIYYPGMPVNPRPVAAAAVQPVPAAAQ
ncbi:efflux transporter, RND family, MFP subunit [Comamonas sp. E6]|nr:efflux transporter, RND family, MFP subunit [Comamonas sp. E6]